MSKCKAKNAIKRATVMLLISFTLINVNVVLGQQTTNPQVGTMIVRYIRNGVECWENISVPGIWCAGYLPWNGRYAVHGPNVYDANGNVIPGQIIPQPVENAEINLTFPCGTNNITAAEVNAYWDARYKGATRIGEPTWNHNCHGHSTGCGYWVQQSGWWTIKFNDYHACWFLSDIVPGSVWEQNSDHTVKIISVIDSGNGARHVSETTEKMAYAGTYHYQYFTLGVTPPIGVTSVYYPRD